MTDFLTTLKELVGKRRSAGESGTRSEYERLDREVKSILSLHAEDIVALVEAADHLSRQGPSGMKGGYWDGRDSVWKEVRRLIDPILSRLETKP